MDVGGKAVFSGPIPCSWIQGSYGEKRGRAESFLEAGDTVKVLGFERGPFGG